MIRRPMASLTVAAVLSGVLVSCGGDDDAATPPAPTTASNTADPTVTSTSSDVAEATAPSTTEEPPLDDPPSTSEPDEPDEPAVSPARRALDDVIGWLNGDPLSEREYTDRFADSFIDDVSFDEFQQLLLQLVDQAPWELVDEPAPVDEEKGDDEETGDEDKGDEESGGLSAELFDGQGDRYAVTLVLTDPDGEIEVLFIEPNFGEPESPGDALRQLSELGTLRFVEAEVESDECRAVIEVDPDDPMPIGSMFKLYVLGAVVDAVAAGTIDWDTSVVVRDELRSIPAGITQDEETGAELTVEELATRMISISDNTATDLLIDLVGRDAVEVALVDYGHADPAITLPLLTTRELTILKFTGDDLAERYAAATTGERRAMLDDEVADAELPPLDDITAAGTATAETIEWFASPLDICRALARLSRSAVALEMLAVNPGVPQESDRWTYIGFKGGSSPGVLAAGWLVEDDEGVRTVVAGGVSNTGALIPETAAIDAFARLRDAAAP